MRVPRSRSGIAPRRTHDLVHAIVNGVLVCAKAGRVCAQIVWLPVAEVSFPAMAMSAAGWADSRQAKYFSLFGRQKNDNRNVT